MAKEKRQWNSKMNGKALEKSVSEEQAGVMCRNQGSRYMLIVEVHAGPKMVNEDGSEVVNLIPDLVELVPSEHEDRIRTFQRALYIERPEQYGQQAFESISDTEPRAADAGAALDAAVKLGEDDEPVGMWSGDPDAPLTHFEDPDAAPTATPVDDGPAFDEQDDADTGSPNVVAFTHKG